MPSSASPAPSPPARPSLLDSIALPFFIFAAVFFCGTILLLFLVRPARYPVHMGQSVLRVGDLQMQEEILVERERDLRNALALSVSLVPTPTLDAVKHAYAARTRIPEGLIALHHALHTHDGRRDASIRIDSVRTSEDARSLTVTGIAHDRNGRSVQLLAAFVDRLRAADTYAQVSEPRYVQEAAPDGGSISPFALVLVLADAS